MNTPELMPHANSSLYQEYVKCPAGKILIVSQYSPNKTIYHLVYKIEVAEGIGFRIYHTHPLLRKSYVVHLSVFSAFKIQEMNIADGVEYAAQFLGKSSGTGTKAHVFSGMDQACKFLEELREKVS